MQFENKGINLRQKLEYLNYVQAHKIQLGMCHNFNLTTLKTNIYRSMLAVTRGRLELAMTCGRDGPAFPKLDFMTFGATYVGEKGNLSVQYHLDPQNPRAGNNELYFGASKLFSGNLLFKARYAWFSGISTYYTMFRPHNDITFAGTVQMATRPAEGVMQGFCGIPFNFGLQIGISC